jgi:hypothetical protein
LHISRTCGFFTGHCGSPQNRLGRHRGAVTRPNATCRPVPLESSEKSTCRH